MFSKDDITAGDGKKCDVLPGKGELANAITCNVFNRLQHHGVPLAFVERDGDSFITHLTDMIPLEIVVRNRATGSALKRYEGLEDGHIFSEPKVEFFYKTTGGIVDGKFNIRVDDPFVVLNMDGELELYPADGPPRGEPLHTIEPPEKEPGYFPRLLRLLTELALLVNIHLSRAWEQ